jgi:hypothetical protein
VRISGDEAGSVLFEVEACCRAPVRQPLANVYVINLIGDGHVRFQIKANSSGATEFAILVVELAASERRAVITRACSQPAWQRTSTVPSSA